jgi:hypothetical protein
MINETMINDDLLKDNYKTLMKQEFDWIAHLGIRTIIYDFLTSSYSQTPSTITFISQIFSELIKSFSNTEIWVQIDLIENDDFKNWENWNCLRMLNDFSSRISLILSFSSVIIHSDNIIKKYKLEDIDKITNILVDHINKLQSPLLKYFIEKDNNSDYVQIFYVCNNNAKKN